MPSLLQLPPPSLSLPPWAPESSASWGSRARRASLLVTRAGVGRHFRTLIAEARTALVVGDPVDLGRRAEDRRFLEAYTVLVVGIAENTARVAAGLR